MHKKVDCAVWMKDNQYCKLRKVYIAKWREIKFSQWKWLNQGEKLYSSIQQPTNRSIDRQRHRDRGAHRLQYSCLKCKFSKHGTHKRELWPHFHRVFFFPPKSIDLPRCLHHPFHWRWCIVHVCEWALFLKWNFHLDAVQKNRCSHCLFVVSCCCDTYLWHIKLQLNKRSETKQRTNDSVYEFDAYHDEFLPTHTPCIQKKNNFTY